MTNRPLALRRHQTTLPICPSKGGSRRLWREKTAPGFTLVEVLMASAILAIGLVGVASVISQASLQDVRASHLAHANFLVEEFLEKASRAQYSTQAFNALTDTTVNRVIEGVRFSLNCTMTENSPVERCKEMTCILTWDNSGSHASARYVYVLSPKF